MHTTLQILRVKIGDFFSPSTKLINPTATPLQLVNETAVALLECDLEIAECNKVLILASKKEFEDTNKVYEDLSRLEKLMRKRNKLDGGLTVCDV